MRIGMQGRDIFGMTLCCSESSALSRPADSGRIRACLDPRACAYDHWRMDWGGLMQFLSAASNYWFPDRKERQSRNEHECALGG
jgi:hypothetical protein